MAESTTKLMRRHRDAEESELLAACRRGERWAQHELFEHHSAALYRALLALAADPALAEDLLQETFLRAYLAIGEFRGHSSVRTWLVRIGTNVFFENRRRFRMRRRHLAQIEEEASAASLRLVSSGGKRHEEPRELQDLALRGLAALRVADRMIITLHDLEGYRYGEIAEILDIAPGTVGSRLSRARERLAGAIRELLGLRAEEELTPAHLHGRAPNVSANHDPRVSDTQARADGEES